MRRRRMAVVASIIAIIVVVGWRVISKGNGDQNNRYGFVTIERGDLENVITGTGTLSAVGTVEVGTQVSGTIDQLRVDFNDNVEKDQVLAVLDTTMLAAAVQDAQAGVQRAQAQYEQARRDVARDEELFGSQFVSEEQLQNSRTSMEISHATLVSAQATLLRARVNLKYAVITSPIDGTVIQRNVEPGQTVAASFSTPTLFLIAEDLSKMEIHGLVDESDIGQIKEGQPVRFTVEAYIDETFEGTVRQIRLQPQTIQNVVNYTVVIDAANDEGLLYPGMTATIDFIAERVEDVLLVPNKALRLQPTVEMMTQLRRSMQKRTSQVPDSLRAVIQQRGAQRQGSDPGGVFGFPGEEGGRGGVGRLWYLDDEGALRVARVLKGATDGIMTEIVPAGGPESYARPGMRPSGTGETGSSTPMLRAPFEGEIEEGTQVISAVANAGEENTDSGGREGRPPGPPMRLF